MRVEGEKRKRKDVIRMGLIVHERTELCNEVLFRWVETGGGVVSISEQVRFYKLKPSSDELMTRENLIKTGTIEEQYLPAIFSIKYADWDRAEEKFEHFSEFVRIVNELHEQSTPIRTESEKAARAVADILRRVDKGKRGVEVEERGDEFILYLYNN